MEINIASPITPGSSGYSAASITPGSSGNFAAISMDNPITQAAVAILLHLLQQAAVIILLPLLLGQIGVRVVPKKGKLMGKLLPLRLHPTGESSFRQRNFANVANWRKLGENILAIGDVFMIGWLGLSTLNYVFLDII